MIMNIGSYIDFSMLRPDGLPKDIDALGKIAVERSFKAICIPPYFVDFANQHFSGTTLKIATVVGFPMGYSSTSAKIEEIKKATADGAHEVDAVINVSAVKSGNWNYVANEIGSMVTACHMRGKMIKVILEAHLLTDVELRKVIEICIEAKADFIKNSTGFNGGKADPVLITYLKSLVGDSIKIKASGGIRSLEESVSLIEAGADRIGSSVANTFVNN